MSQLAIDFSPGLPSDTDRALRFVGAYRGKFSPGFAEWLGENGHVWREFAKQANAVWEIGRRHYSARTIGEFLRHHSALRENGPEWKLNNNHFPDLARLFELSYPDRPLFEFRVMPTSQRTA